MGRTWCVLLVCVSGWRGGQGGKEGKKVGRSRLLVLVVYVLRKEEGRPWTVWTFIVCGCEEKEEKKKKQTKRLNDRCSYSH